MDYSSIYLNFSVKYLLGGLIVGYSFGLLSKWRSLWFNSSKETKDLTKELETNVIPNYTIAMVVNNSLKMGKGKIAAQCGHAILSLFKRAKKRSKKSLEKWIEEGQDIMLVSVKSTDEFDDLAQMSTMESLEYYVVADAGRTQIQSGSLTVMAIGPGPRDIINSVVGQLPLYL